MQELQSRLAGQSTAADANAGRIAGLEAALVEGEAAAAAELNELKAKAAEDVARAEAQVGLSSMMRGKRSFVDDAREAVVRR